jgi:DNA-binding transcriptional regulator YhcF (GntR family)
MAMEKEITNFQAKYGRRILYFGFTQTPNLLIRKWKSLGLTSWEFVLLLYLMSYGLAPEIIDQVCPSLIEMSRNTGLSTATIHKAKQGLVNKGFIAIQKTKNTYSTNIYKILAREKLDKNAKREIRQLFLAEKISLIKYDELMGVQQKINIDRGH